MIVNLLYVITFVYSLHTNDNNRRNIIYRKKESKWCFCILRILIFNIKEARNIITANLFGECVTYVYIHVCVYHCTAISYTIPPGTCVLCWWMNKCACVCVSGCVWGVYVWVLGGINIRAKLCFNYFIYVIFSTFLISHWYFEIVWLLILSKGHNYNY